jgi:two-component system, NarL family, nitrate/nitrite response regulator NarL
MPPGSAMPRGEGKDPIDRPDEPTEGAVRSVRVVLSDDESMFRACVRQLLSVPPAIIRELYEVDLPYRFDVVGEAGSGQETIALVHSTEPDLLLLDLSMPRMSGLEALSELMPFSTSMRTIVFAGAIERPDLLTAVQLGIRGFVLKDSTTDVLFQAIASVLAGNYCIGHTLVKDLMDIVRMTTTQVPGRARHAFGLTPREHEVLGLVSAGYPNKEIARKVAVSHDTVKHHLTRIYGKVGVSNRVELMREAMRNGLLRGSRTPEPTAQRP